MWFPVDQGLEVRIALANILPTTYDVIVLNFANVNEP